MKPNFALNLSHEGISLLHRAKTGWLRVGDVALDAPDLDAQLNLLRRTAADLETGGLTTKLVIPNSQILYTEIDAPGPDTAARISQIRDALVGLTPYDVADLVFDWRMKGKQAHVAVVARETLREAESFASQYRFNPVSFVAVPVNGAFEGEPFFGPTRLASSLLVGGDVIEPDNRQIRILGQVENGAKKARPKPAPEAAPEPPAEARAEAAAAGEAALASASGAGPAPELERALPAVTFASRRKQIAAPASRADGPRDPLQTGFDDEPGDEPDQLPERQNGATRDIPAFHRQAASRPGVAGVALYGAPQTIASLEAKTRVPTAGDAAAATETVDDAPDTTPMAVTAPHTAETDVPKDKPAAPRGQARQKAKSSVVGGIGKLAHKAPATAAAEPKPAPTRSAAAEAEAMTVFGARGREPQRGKPKFLGLFLTLLLLVALAVMALWSTYFMDRVTSGLLGSVEDAPAIAAPAVTPQPAPIESPTAASPAVATAAPSQETAALPEPEPASAAPVEETTTAIEAAVEAALEEPEAERAEAPEAAAPEAAETASEELALLIAPAPEAETPAAAALPEPAAEPVAEPAAEADPAAEPEVEAVLEPEAEAPAPEPVDPAPERVPPPTPAEAAARYAATGIWQLDPEPLADVPGGGDQLEDLYIASIDPRIGSSDAVALPGAGALDTDGQPAALNPPAPLGTTFDFDERGLIRATPDGALTPGGVPVFSGAPAVVPGPRPADLEVPIDETQLMEEERLRGLLPPARPGGLEEANERARLGGLSNLELAAIRPVARPLSSEEANAPVIDPEAVAEAVAEAAAEEIRTPAVDPVTIGENATARAVAVSHAPPVRPTNFAGVVERALAEATRAPPEPLVEEEDDEPEVLVATAAARMPPVPSRASVAKQATVRNAINLRKVNLIGVYGSPSKRRALVRLGNGKYVKVEVGDRVDGGRVAAIGNDELRYIKGGRSIVLKLPKG